MTAKAWMLCALLPLVAASATAKQPPTEILGIRLGMTQPEVSRRLLKIGSRVEQGDSDLKQLWNLRHRRFGSVLVRFDEERSVKWVTAYARPDRRLRYSDVADTTRAQRNGYYIYTWTVPSQGERRGYLVSARGKSPEFFSSMSLSVLPPPRRPADAAPAPPDSLE